MERERGNETVNRRRGFTLIELTAVLVIMALLSAVVGLSLASVSWRTDLREVRGAIADLDRTMRVECVDYERTGQLVFDEQTGLIELNMVRAGQSVRVQAYQLPVGMRLASVRVNQDGPAAERDKSVIACDTQGHTPSYALVVTTTTNSQANEQPLRLIVAGLSGQVREVQDETPIDNLFATLASGHAD